MRRILVTGAAGFVGRHVVAALGAAAGRSDQIIGIGRGNPGNLPEGISFRQIDLLDEALISNFIAEYQPTEVLHLAALASVQQSASRPAETWRVNLVALLNLAEAVVRSARDATFFFVSSGEVYGRAFLAGNALTEDVPPEPQGNYARSKWFGEEILREVLRESNVRHLILRPFNHIGSGQDERFVVPSFAGQIARIEAGLAPPVLEVGNLSAKRDFLPIGDVVKAYVELIGRGRAIADGSVLNIASGLPRSIESVLADLRQHSSTAFEVRFAANRTRPSEIPVAAGDSSRLRQAIGWAATEDWDTALASVLAEARAKTRQFMY